MLLTRVHFLLQLAQLNRLRHWNLRSGLLFRKLHLRSGDVQVEETHRLLHLSYVSKTDTREEVVTGNSVQLHPDLPHRHHVLGFLLDQTGCCACTSHSLCHVSTHAEYTTRSVPEIAASCFIYQSYRYLHVQLYSVRVRLTHGVRNREHPDDSGRAVQPSHATHASTGHCHHPDSI